MNVVQRFLNECCKKRKITEIPPAELDSPLCNFYITAKKKDNTECEPDTMSAFLRSIQRYLDNNSAKSEENSLNPSVENSGSRAKGTNQMPQ